MSNPPCARCGHDVLCHETNWAKGGPCWKCLRCPGYVVETVAELMGPPPLPPAGFRQAVMRAILAPLPDEIPGHLHREIETWTDDCGCTWANTSTRTTTCAGHAK